MVLLRIAPALSFGFPGRRPHVLRRRGHSPLVPQHHLRGAHLAPQPAGGGGRTPVATSSAMPAPANNRRPGANPEEKAAALRACRRAAAYA